MSDSTSINALIAGQHNASVIDSLANPPQVNVLGSISRATEAAQGVMRMRALQSQQAWGEALQQATDPNTGTVDYPKATAIAAKDPRMPMGMATATEGASARMNEQVSRGHMLLGMTYGAVGGLPANATRAQVLAVLGRLKAAGAPGVDEEMAAVPQNDADVPAYVKQMNLAADSAFNQFHARVGTPTTIDQGPNYQGATRSEETGAITPAGPPIPKGPSPEFTQNKVEWVGSDGTPQQGDNETYQQQLKAGAVRSSPAAPGTYGGPAAATPSAKTPIAGVQPGMQEKWKASADQFNRDNEAAGSYQQRVFPLAQVASILASGDVTTGQGADAINRAKSFLQTAATSMGWDAQTIQQADYDKVVKYMQQYVNAQGMSQRSDQALASALTGNPSAHLSTIANKDVIKPLIGMERMRQMAITDFKAQNGNPRDYSDFLAKWQNTHDPRAFIFDMLGKEERTKMIAGMKTAEERKRFSDTLDIVERNPGLMGQAALPH